MVTLADLGDRPVEEVGYQLGRFWGIGVGEDTDGKRLDNGAMLIVAPNDRAVRIEVGYGLEPQLTDALSSVILQTKILPAFREGDFDGGVIAGTDAMLAVLAGDTESWQDRRRRAGSRAMAEDEGGFPWPLLIFMIIFFGVQIINGSRRGVYNTGPGRRRMDRASSDALAILMASQMGRRHGGSGWSGGGFGGGGFGGGFGGGGGSFGGGGASGSW